MKNQKGITLIALVITIIVLLILAGVSIAMLTGDNGILSKASGAGEKSTVGEIAETVKLGVADIIANQMDPTYTGSENTITTTNVENAIKRNNSNIGIEGKDNGAKIKVKVDGNTDDVTVTWTNSDSKVYTWKIEAKGKITQEGPKAAEG